MNDITVVIAAVVLMVILAFGIAFIIDMFIGE